MRIRGFFLRSRVARRTFWVLLAAALLPLALFALVAGQAYLAERDARQHRDETEYLKHIGLRAFDRLVAARATLAAHAAEGRFDAPSLAGPAGQRVLARLATVTGDRSHGDAVLAADWRRAGGEGLGGSRELW